MKDVAKWLRKCAMKQPHAGLMGSDEYHFAAEVVEAMSKRLAALEVHLKDARAKTFKEAAWIASKHIFVKAGSSISTGYGTMEILHDHARPATQEEIVKALEACAQAAANPTLGRVAL